jgi:hypothetical protein
METLLSLMVGLGLSAACGFRVFVPLLVLSIAGYSGHVQLAKGFEWLASEPALIAFSLATILEIAAYYIPVVDNFLDTVATPAAVVAGTIVTASMVTDVSPFLQWSLAAVAGGGIAGVVQGATVMARGASTALTGGLANPVVATVELGTSAASAVMAFFTPVLVLLGVFGLLGIGLVAVSRRKGRKPAAVPAIPTH